MSMSPEDTQLLAAIGRATYYNTIQSNVETFTWAIHLLVSFLALYSLAPRALRQNSTPSKLLLGALLTLVAVNTFRVIGAIKVDLQAIEGRFIRELDLSLRERVVSTGRRIDGSGVYRALLFFGGQSGLLILIGDVIIVWRAWLIWMGRKVWMAIPIFLLVVSAVTGLYSSVLSINAATVVRNSDTVAITGITTSACSIAANAVTTFMIGLQAYQHRKIMRDIIKHGSSPAVRILLFLTEGGLVYLAMQVISFTLTILVTPSSPAHYAIWAQVWSILTSFVSTTLPAIVILMAAYNSSLSSDSGISGSLNDLETHISFVGGRGVTRELEGLGEHASQDSQPTSVVDMDAESGPLGLANEKNITN